MPKAGSRSGARKAAPLRARRPPPIELAERPTLEAVLENLGSTVAGLVVAPHGLDVPVGEPTIYDPIEQSPLEPGALVLAIGITPASPQASLLIKDAGVAGASVVVFKHAEDLEGLSREAETAGVAVLSVPEEMTWTQLNALLANAVRFPPQRDAVGGLAGVPIGDLFALANAIAAMVGGAVTIEDPHRRVLGYSTLEDQPIDEGRRMSILGRQVPDFPGMRDLYRRVWATEGVMRADRALLQKLLGAGPPVMRGLEARAAVAIRAGNEILGSVWVVHGPKPLTKEPEHALSEAARIAVPHMIQARATRDVERRMRGEMLRALLEGRGSAEAMATRLGISPAGPLAVLAFRFVPTDDAVEELHRERLVDLVAVYGEAFRRQTVTAAMGRTAYALLPVDKQMGRDRLLQLAKDIATHAEGRLRMPLRAAAGSTVDSMRELPRARREADRVLQVLENDRKKRTVAAIEEVRSEVVLLELRDLAAEHPELARGRLEDVIAYDAENGSAYTETLRAYLDAFGDVPTAAERISVHPNTFRYRLKRLLEIFDLDMDDAEERLVLSLQLRLLPSNP
jgi:DNA-binding PucR family transcriptional regulator